MRDENPPILAPIHKLKPCKHGVKGLCTLCAYKNTGKRKSSLNRCEQDIVDFMSDSLNRRLKELYD